jgi:hypothetical protein
MKATIILSVFILNFFISYLLYLFFIFHVICNWLDKLPTKLLTILKICKAETSRVLTKNVVLLVQLLNLTIAHDCNHSGAHDSSAYANLTPFASMSIPALPSSVYPGFPKWFLPVNFSHQIIIHIILNSHTTCPAHYIPLHFIPANSISRSVYTIRRDIHYAVFDSRLSFHPTSVSIPLLTLSVYVLFVLWETRLLSRPFSGMFKV